MRTGREKVVLAIEEAVTMNENGDGFTGVEGEVERERREGRESGGSAGDGGRGGGTGERAAMALATRRRGGWQWRRATTMGGWDSGGRETQGRWVMLIKEVDDEGRSGGRHSRRWERKKEDGAAKEGHDGGWLVTEAKEGEEGGEGGDVMVAVKTKNREEKGKRRRRGEEERGGCREEEGRRGSGGSGGGIDDGAQ